MTITIKRGTFSKVHVDSESDTVQIISSDNAKECMANGWFPEHRMFPIVEYSNVEGFNYQMKKYDIKFKKDNVNADDWKVYRTLRLIFNGLLADHNSEQLHQAFDNATDLPEDVCNALKEAIDAMGNYGDDVCFEISPRNCAVTEQGELILLDCFYSRSQFLKVKNKSK